jgi:hypothetical protein
MMSLFSDPLPEYVDIRLFEVVDRGHIYWLAARNTNEVYEILKEHDLLPFIITEVSHPRGMYFIKHPDAVIRWMRTCQGEAILPPCILSQSRYIYPRARVN